MTKHIPYGSACIAQTWSLIFFPLMIPPFVLKLTWPILVLPVGIIVFFWVCDIIVLVLSLTKWWNVPIQINPEGISKNKEPTYLWSAATDISIKRKFPTKYGGYLHVRMIIRYSNGRTISFEPGDPIIKSIRKYCHDEAFLDKFNKVLEQD